MALDKEFLKKQRALLQAEKTKLEKLLGVMANKDPYIKGEYDPKIENIGSQLEDEADEYTQADRDESKTQVLEKRLVAVKNALEHLDAGTYGTSKTGQSIPRERLEADPTATTVV